MDDPNQNHRIERAASELLEACVYAYAVLSAANQSEHARKMARVRLAEAIQIATGIRPT